MEYWHELITEKSFNLLKELKRDYKFILIGGWAVFLYTKALKSKDIDIVLDFDQLSELKKRFLVLKNERLRKYEIKKEGIDIDIYLPYYSDPGLPPQEIKKFTTTKEGFIVPVPEVLLILKLNVFKNRRGSPKGEKDKIDIFSLLSLVDLNWQKFKEILQIYRKEELKEDLVNLLKSTRQLKAIGLSSHKMARLKKRILAELES